MQRDPHILKKRRASGGGIRILPVVAVAAAVAALLLLPASARAGRGDRTGTSAAPELLIPVGARSIALGGASLATVSGVEALYWNPAGLARAEGSTAVMASHMSYLADIGVDCAAAGTDVAGALSLGLSIKSLSFGQIAVTTEDHPDGTGETASPTFLVIGGTIARRISDRITAGVTSNLVYEKMADVSSTGIAFTAGLQYSGLGGIDGLSFGVAAKNIGPRMRYDGDGLLRKASVEDALQGIVPVKIQAASSDLPSTIEIGLGYKHAVSGSNSLVLTSTFQNNDYSDDEYRFGGEFVVQQTLFLRAGYVYSSPSDGRDYIYGPSAGVGIHAAIQNVEIAADYAYRSVKIFSGNHVLSLTVVF